MHRILSLAVGAVLVSASVQVLAQQPQAPRATRTVTPQQAPVARATSVVPTTAPRAMAGTPTVMRTTVLTTIQGNTLTSTNGPLPGVIVRLRDARIGRIVDTQVSDRSGLFEFKVVDPGVYIVEIMGDDQTVLAASQLLSVNSGEVISAIVKLPLRVLPLAGVLGTPSALAVTAAAGAAQVLAVQTTTDTSPEH
jgi:hypothetical protein